MEWSELYHLVNSESCEFRDIEICPSLEKCQCDECGDFYFDYLDLMHSEYEEAIYILGLVNGWEERDKAQCQYEENKWKESH